MKRHFLLNDCDIKHYYLYNHEAVIWTNDCDIKLRFSFYNRNIIWGQKICRHEFRQLILGLKN